MSTKLDNRKILVNLIEKLDSSDMNQVLAYTAGYEAGKLVYASNISVNEHVHQEFQNNHPA